MFYCRGQTEAKISSAKMVPFSPPRAAIFYEGTEPILYVRDLDLIRRVLITDFDHFTDSALFTEETSVIPGNDIGIVNARGEEWRSIKATISPAFSMKNLKAMTVEIDKVASRLVEHLKRKKNLEEPVEVEEVAMNFTMDCIARMVFSMDINSAENPGNEFCRMGNKFFAEVWRFILSMMFPGVAVFFKIPAFSPEATQYFEKVRNV